MIDTHCHLVFSELVSDIDAIVERARLAGVDRFIVPAVDADTAESAVLLASQYPGQVKAAVGVHPLHTEGEEDREVISSLLQEQRNSIVAIGEIGMDYYHKEVSPDVQKERLDYFTELALREDLPVILHARECLPDMYAELRNKNLRAVVHCFSDTWDEAQKWLDLGYMLSVTGIITYTKNAALREVVRQIPLDRLMLETDSPYLAPEGFRGQLGEPRFVRQVAECVAVVKGLSLEEIDTITSRNAEQFFAL